MSDRTSTPSRRNVLAASAAVSAASLLSTNATFAGDDTNERTAIRPFPFNAPEAELIELRRRINATKWPERETVTDDRKACSSRRCRSSRATGRTEYDWRKIEAKLKALPQFITEIDGLDIHFIHVRSKHENALPIIVTHGWPGSIIEQMKIIDPLTNPTAHGGSASDAFHVVIPSMPGYGFSGKPTTHRLGSRPHRPCLGHADEAPRLHAICGAGRRLGRAGHASRWACRRRRNCSASTPTCRPPCRPKLRRRSPVTAPPPGLSADEKRAFERLDFFFTHGLAYAQEMGNRPQTLYGDCGFTGRARRLVPRP